MDVSYYQLTAGKSAIAWDGMMVPDVMNRKTTSLKKQTCPKRADVSHFVIVLAPRTEGQMVPLFYS